jgi:hypothetical protein
MSNPKDDLPVTMEETLFDWVTRIAAYVWNTLAGIGALAALLFAAYLYGLMDVRAATTEEVKCGSCRVSKEFKK